MLKQYRLQTATTSKQHRPSSIMASVTPTVVPTPAPYPASTKRATGNIKNVPTEVMIVGLADKIMITITQDGRLAQWV